MICNLVLQELNTWWDKNEEDTQQQLMEHNMKHGLFILFMNLFRRDSAY